MNYNAEASLVQIVLSVISIAFAVSGVILWWKAKKRGGVAGFFGVALLVSVGMPFLPRFPFGHRLLILNPMVIVLAFSIGTFVAGLNVYLRK